MKRLVYWIDTRNSDLTSCQKRSGLCSLAKSSTAMASQPQADEWGTRRRLLSATPTKSPTNHNCPIDHIFKSAPSHRPLTLADRLGSSLTTLLLIWLLPVLGYAQTITIQGSVKDESGTPMIGAQVFIASLGKGVVSNLQGTYLIKATLKPNKEYWLYVYHLGYQLDSLKINTAKKQWQLDFQLKEDLGVTRSVVVENYLTQVSFQADIDRDNANIYATIKSEVIDVESLTANKAGNNAKQLFARIPGVNVWESDGGGLQLGIGARGLDPNRTSNFNVRQNGYDISADALGYPESYYTPPAEAISKIEVVRGAASLQYGTQFGGLVNFKLKEGPDDTPFQLTTRQTGGSFGFFNSFNSIGGKIGKVRYYSYYHYRRGDGWRPNSGFDMQNAHANVVWTPTERLLVKLEFTHMDYLAQQPGGLTDFQFSNDPTQSNRERNWFAVNWNMPSLTVNWHITDRTDFNMRAFGLLASREALGYLKRINTLDPLANRTLMRDQYHNVGTELRLMHRYSILGKDAVVLLGTRLYSGNTERMQGDADADFGANFDFINPDNLENSSYRFPNQNASLFLEQVIQLSPKWTIKPGARFEYIKTQARGYFNQHILNFNGDTIQTTRYDDALSNGRSFLLLGLGLSYRPNDHLEIYTNFSENYRSVTFSDLRRANLSIEIDSAITDESGYNFDIGMRGQNQWLTYDVGLFHLRYRDRIGQIFRNSPPPVFRTNIADAYTQGIELYVEADLWHLLLKARKTNRAFSPFLNASWIRGKYLNGEAAVRGKQVELVPPMTIRTGFRLRVEDFRFSFQFNHVSEHYTDATNARDAPSSEIGLIPTYQVMDIAASYTFKSFELGAGINNLTNTSYFTRRATGYPGPGIIPADVRNFFVTLQWQLSMKNQPNLAERCVSSP